MKCDHLNKLSILFQQLRIKIKSLVEIGQVVSEEKFFDNIIHVYCTGARENTEINFD